MTSRPSRWKIAVTAFAVLILMLSSQVTGSLSADMRAQSEVPLSSNPLSQGESSTPPTQSQPVPLSYTNTWSRTPSTTCTTQASAMVSQPLALQKGQSVTFTSEVLVVLGGASIAAQPTRDTFTVYANGTFLASDGQGNSISWRRVTGFPPGMTAVKLYANSTEALQLYTVGPAAHVFANFSVIYQPSTEACQPHGLDITIQGSVDWPGAHGTLALGFGGKLLRWNSSQAAFGGNGGGGFVFDWSDSMKTNPSTYVTNAISWSVGDNFKIDPYLVGTSQSQQALNWGGQRHLWHTVETNGTTEYWAFFYDGADSIEDAWSLNGVSWHSAEFLAAEYAATTSDSMYSSWVTENGGVFMLYFVFVDPATKQFDLGVGQLGNSGAITGVTQTWISTAWGSDNFPCVYGSSGGVLAGVATSNGGSSQLEVFDINPSNGHVNSKSTIGTGSAQDGCIALGLTSGYALLYAPADTGAGPVVITTTANGVSWNAPLTTSTSGDITMSSAVSKGNTVEFAMVENPGNEVFWNCEYPCRATGPVQTLASHATDATLDNIVLSTNARTGGSLITATYHDALDTYSRTSEDNGSTWSPPQLVDNGSEGQMVSGSLQADYDYVTGALVTVDTVDIAFVTPVSNGYGIWFPAYPAVVPTASTSSSPWAQPGYSPYETYFSQLDEYVSPGSGLLGISQTDLSIPGRSPALSVTRVYSMPDGFVGGHTSTTPYDQDAYALSDLGDGWQLAFPWIGAGFFHPGDGASIPLAFNSSGIMEENGALNFVLYHFSSNSSYALYTSDGMRYVYDSSKQLLEIVSPDSTLNTLTFTYNTTPGYIIQIKDAEGHIATFTYNANQTLASMSSSGLTTKYTYSGADLSTVTDPLGRVTRFLYTAFNPWLIDEVSYATGAATLYDYSYALVAPYIVTFVVSDQTEYSMANSKSLTLARGNGYQYTMVDGSMVSTRVTFTNNTNAVQGSALLEYRQVNGKNVQQEFQYDQSGNALGSVETTFTKAGEPNSTTLLSPKGAVLATSVTHYDEWGNVNFTQDYGGHDVYYAYANTKDQYKLGSGATGLKESYYTNSTVGKRIHTDLLATAEFQDAANSATPEETFYLYNQNEVLRQTELYVTPGGATTWLTTRFTYDQYGNLATTTDPLQHETCYAYSVAYNSGYLTSQTSSGTSNCGSNPDVNVSYTYNFATGTVASETDGEGNTTSYTYDAAGRVLQVSYPAVNGVVAKASYSYNDAQGTVTATGPDGNVTKYYYDGLGRLTEEQDYLTPTSPYSTEYFSYNWLNQVVTDEKPNGAMYRYTYDSLGQATGVLNPDGSHESASYNDTANTVTTTDGDGHVTQDVYDSLQQLVAVREYWTPTTYNVTSYAYDGVGNLVKVTGPDSGQVTTYSYDDLNRVVKTTYPNGTTASSSYDAVGDLVSSVDQESRVTTYSYDYLYRLAAVSYPDGTSTTYTYDNDGDVRSMNNAIDQVKYSYDALGDLLSETDKIGGTAYTTSYTYDPAGNVQSLTYPDGSKVTYSYDALGRVTQIASGGTTYASFTYNVDDTINTMTYGNGEVTSYSYDSMDRPTSIVTSHGSTQELGLSYKYDGAGNVASVNSETFGYDALERLTSTTGGWGMTTYSYDAAGNMVQKQASGSPAAKDTYNSMDELVSSSTSSGATTYSYDGDGDLVIKNDGTNMWTYEYNAQSELTKVLENGVVVQQNYYDGAGDRVEQAAGGVTTLYLYAGDGPLYEKDLQSGVTTKEVYADGMQVASVTSGVSVFLHEDALGSVRLATNQNSATVFSSDYVPFGVTYGASGSSGTMYAGMIYDSATGLYYDNARYYDPTMGRFMTEDPLGGVESDPQSLNGYTYARDDPMAITDPSGLSWSWESFLAGAAIGLAIVIAIALTIPSGGTSDELVDEALGPEAQQASAPPVVQGASQESISALAQAFIKGQASDVMLNSFSESDQLAAYEQAVIRQGGNAIGHYAEGVVKGWLESFGVAFDEQVGYSGKSGGGRADFFINRLGWVFEAKGTSSGGISWSDLPKGQLKNYAFALLTKQFQRVIYVSVPVGGGNYAFSEGAETNLLSSGIWSMQLPRNYLFF